MKVSVIQIEGNTRMEEKQILKRSSSYFWTCIFAGMYAVAVCNYMKFQICTGRGTFIFLSRFWILILLFMYMDIEIKNVKAIKYLSWLEIIALPFASVFLIEIMCNPRHDELKWQYICLNYLVIFIIEILMIQLLNRKMGLYITATLIFVFGMVNYFVIKFKGMPLLPYDFFAVRTAANVMKQYSYNITDSVVTAAIIYAVEICIIKCTGETGNALRKKQYYIRKGILGIACLCIISILYSFDYLQILNFSLNDWEPLSSYYEYGSTFTFFLELQQSKKYKVNGYTRAKAEKLLDKYDAAGLKTDSVEPNVILVMNESFSDLSVLGNIDMDVCLNNWKNSDFAMRGNAYSPIYGGGTANAEFEVLTGSSMTFMGKVIYPYQRYNLKKADNMAKVFKSHDYKCIAVHPANGENWNRKSVYNAFGFDEFLDMDEFDGAEIFGRFVSDRAIYEKVLEKIKEENRPIFSFAVTMQNHGGYHIDTLEKSQLLNIENGLADYDQVITYMSLIKESDNAFKELYDCVMALDEPTVVCMFGDHQPGLGDFEDEFADNLLSTDISEGGEMEWNLRKYIVPYIIFANYDMQESGERQDLSLNYLGAALLNMIGYSTPYFEFVNEMQKEIPVINNNLYMTNNGEWHNDTDENSRIADYNIVQFYNLFEDKN